MDPKELQIETFGNASTGVIMKITHIPTGVTVKGEGFIVFKLKKKLLSELEEMIGDVYEKDVEDNIIYPTGQLKNSTFILDFGTGYCF